MYPLYDSQFKAGLLTVSWNLRKNKKKILPGQIQSPLGTCALTSILPYLKAKLLVILAENIGCTMSFPADL